ncbi:MAG TPA: AsmA family protein [Candidatus Deferrimicrobiaceae bacterium]
MRRAAVILAVVAAVTLIAASAVPRLVSLESYRPRVAAAILESTGRNASFSKISLAVFPFVAVRLSDFSMAGPPGAPGDAFVSAPAAEIRLALLPLLAGRGEPRALVLRRPKIVVRKFRDGSTSAADMFGRLAAQAESARSPVTAVRVEDGRLTVVFEEEDAPESRLELVPFTFRLSGLGLQEKTFSLETGIPGAAKGKLVLSGNAGRAADGKPGGGIPFRASGRLFGQKITVEGTVSAPEGVPDVDLALSLPKADVGELAGAFPTLSPLLSDLHPQGVARIAAQVSGDLRSLGYEVEADLTRAAWKVTEELQKFIDMPCTLVVEGRRFPGVIVVGNAELRFPPLLAIANATFHTATGAREWAVSARIASLAEFAKSRGEGYSKWAPAGRFVLSGSGWRAPGSFEDTYVLEADLSGVGFSAPGSRFAVTGFGGHVTITPGGLEFSPLSGLVGGQRFLLRGNVSLADSPAGELQLQMGYLDLDALFPAREKAGKGKRGKEEAPPLQVALDWASRLSFSTTVSADAGDLWDVGFHRMSGKIRREKGTISFEDLRATVYGGEVRMSGTLGNLGEKPAVRVNLSARGVETSEFLQRVSSFGNYLSGRGTVSLDVAGSRENLAEFLRTAEGSGSVRIADGKIGGVDLQALAAGAAEGRAGAAGGGPRGDTPFRELTAAVTLGSGRMRLADLQVVSGSMELIGDAEIGLSDHTLECLGTLWLSRELSAGPPWSGGKFPFSPEGKTGVPVVVSGTLRSPSVAIDTTAIGRAPGRMLRGGSPGRKGE